MIDLEDVGYLTVRLKPEGMDRPVEVKIDLWNVQTRLFELGQQHVNRPASEWILAVKQLMAEVGLPPVSDYVASEFARRVDLAAAALKNSQAGEPAPGLPASTAASTPSSSLPASG